MRHKIRNDAKRHAERWLNESCSINLKRPGSRRLGHTFGMLAKERRADSPEPDGTGGWAGCVKEGMARRATRRE